MPPPVLFFVSAVGLMAGMSYQRKQQRAQQKQIEAQNRMQAARNAREKRAQLRQARIQQAQIAAQQEAMGGAAQAPGSAAQGATSSISSQYAANVSFLDQMTALSAESAKYGQQAANYGAASGFWNQVGSTALSYGLK